VKRVYVLDGHLESRLGVDKQTKALLRQEGLLSESSSLGNNRLTFCGFMLGAETMMVSLPKTMSLPELDDVPLCKLLFRTLMKYFRENNSSSDSLRAVDSDRFNDISNLSIFNTYNELLDDWSRFGVYRNRKRLTTLSITGKIHWKKQWGR